MPRTSPESKRLAEQYIKKQLEKELTPADRARLLANESQESIERKEKRMSGKYISKAEQEGLNKLTEQTVRAIIENNIESNKNQQLQREIEQLKKTLAWTIANSTWNDDIDSKATTCTQCMETISITVYELEITELQRCLNIIITREADEMKFPLEEYWEKRNEWRMNRMEELISQYQVGLLNDQLKELTNG